jgi:hypothetical protein
MIVCEPDKHTEDISYGSPAANPRPLSTVPTDSRDEVQKLWQFLSKAYRGWWTKSVSALH